MSTPKKWVDKTQGVPSTSKVGGHVPQWIYAHDRPVPCAVNAP